MELRCRGAVIPLERTAIMGVLNVTPDSFSDGGLWSDPDAAVAHGLEMVAGGAAMVDVGGESTRPGARPVPEEEELQRVEPVVRRLAEATDVPISVDTRKASVARRALEAGAAIVNDTAGESGDRALDALVAETGAGVVVMHSRGTPETMAGLARYDDVVGDVAGWLRCRAETLVDAGVRRDAIAVDPGIGFAKTASQSLRLLHHLEEVVALGFPVLVGPSRKSFIGAVLDLPVDERLEGTAAAVAWAVARGARIVRVHDVAPLVRVVKMVDAIRSADEA